MRSPSISGVLVVDKPWGWTSHDVVGHVRRLSGQRDVGHAGTLDPRATGVLVVLLGAATRLSEYVMRSPKCYLARVRLGATTTTDDGGGEIVATKPIDGISHQDVVEALSAFVGAIQQVPPSFAAIKLGGVPAYKLARRGEQPEMAAREVRIDGLALLGSKGDMLEMVVWCSSGTYVRSLARDLGESLGCGAYLDALRRLSSGAFDVNEASDVQSLQALAAEGRLRERILPMDEAVSTWPAIVADAAVSAAVAHGAPVEDAAVTHAEADYARIYAFDGRFLALARYDSKRRSWQPDKVFV